MYHVKMALLLVCREVPQLMRPGPAQVDVPANIMCEGAASKHVGPMWKMVIKALPTWEDHQSSMATQHHREAFASIRKFVHDGNGRVISRITFQTLIENSTERGAHCNQELPWHPRNNMAMA